MKTTTPETKATQPAQHTPGPLAGNDGLNEIHSGLDFLDRQLWPAQSGWSDDMQTAIENLHFHKAQIFVAVDDYHKLKASNAELLAALQALADCGSQEHDENPMARTCSPEEPENCALCAARAAIAKATGGQS